MLNLNFTESDDTDMLSHQLQQTLMIDPDLANELTKVGRRSSKSQPLLNHDELFSSPPRMLLMNPHNLRTIEFIEDFNQAVFLFADIKDFSILSQQIPSRALIDLLNTIFSAFQHIVEQHGADVGISVVKLQGDCIMLAAGHVSPDKTQKQVNAMIYIGLLLSNFMFALNKQKSDHQVDFRFGIHMGKATKTLTRIKESNGQIRQQIDWFGEAVNKASRMESSSHPNQVQVTDDIYQMAKKDFEFSTQTIRAIKGYGEIATRFILIPTSAFLKVQGEMASPRAIGGSTSSELPRKMSPGRSCSTNQ